jgi:multiple sugar transport system substrate-binding protein
MRAKTKLAFFMAFVVSVCFMFGCSGKSEQKAAQGSGPIELRAIWWGGPARNDMMNAIYDRYEKLNPNVKIIREYSDWGDYWIKYSTQLAGGKPADIIQFTDRELKQYVAQNAAVELSPYVKSGLLDLSNFSKSAIAAGSIGEKIYMIAMGLSTPLIEYNETALTPAGFGLPHDDMSWEEFTQYLINVTKSGKLPKGMYALQDIASDILWFQTFMRHYGKELADANGNLGYTAQEAKVLFQWMEDMRKAGVIAPYSVTAEFLGKPKEEAQIVKGACAMFVVAGNQSKIYQNNTKDTLGLSRLPTMPNGVNPRGEIVVGAYLSVSPTSKYIDEAVKVISFFVNDIEANRIFNCEQGIPGSTVVQKGIEDIMHPMDIKVSNLLNETLLDIPAPVPCPNGALAIISALTAANQAIAYGQMTVDKAVEQFMTESRQALEDAKR